MEIGRHESPLSYLKHLNITLIITIWCEDFWKTPVRAMQRFVKYCLWLLAEIAVIAADIPEGIISSLLYYVKLILDTYRCPWLLLNAVLIRHVNVSVLFLFVTFRLLEQTNQREKKKL